MKRRMGPKLCPGKWVCLSIKNLPLMVEAKKRAQLYIVRFSAECSWVSDRHVLEMKEKKEKTEKKSQKKRKKNNPVLRRQGSFVLIYIAKRILSHRDKESLCRGCTWCLSFVFVDISKPMTSPNEKSFSKSVHNHSRYSHQDGFPSDALLRVCLLATS